MATINNPNEISNLFGLFESDAGITTQNNIGVGSSPNDVNFWDNLELISPGNLIQPDENLMPEFRSTATPNNFPAISFDGVDEFLKISGAFFLSQTRTVAMVVKFPPAAPAGPAPITLLHIAGSGVGAEVLRITPAGNLEIQDEPGTFTAITVPEGTEWQFDTWAVLLYTVAQGNPSQYNLRIAGGPAGSPGTLAVAAPNSFSLGSFEDGTESADIEVASVVMYNQKLAGSEILCLELFLTEKYFVVVPPPPPPPPTPPPTLAPQSGVGLKRRPIRYSDIDLDFLPNPITGAVPRKLNEESVKRSIRNLVQLNKYEKPFHPEIHSGLRGLLFELVTPANAVLVQRRMIELIARHERRIELLGLDVTDQHEKNLYDITITFRVLNQEQPTILNFSLARLR